MVHSGAEFRYPYGGVIGGFHIPAVSPGAGEKNLPLALQSGTARNRNITESVLGRDFIRGPGHLAIISTHYAEIGMSLYSMTSGISAALTSGR